MASSSSPSQAVLETIHTVLEIDYEATVKELDDTYKRLNIPQYPDKVSETTNCTGLESNSQPTVEEMDEFCKRLAMAQCPGSAPFAGDDASLNFFNSDMI